MKKDTKRLIADNIKRYRTELKLTQQQLGLLLGYNEENAQVRIQQYEVIKRSPNKATLEKMASVLKKPVNVFYSDDGRSHEQTKSSRSSAEVQPSFVIADEQEREFIKLRREAERYGADVVQSIEKYGRWMIEEAKKTSQSSRKDGSSRLPAHKRKIR